MKNLLFGLACTTAFITVFANECTEQLKDFGETHYNHTLNNTRLINGELDAIKEYAGSRNLGHRFAASIQFLQQSPDLSRAQEQQIITTFLKDTPEISVPTKQYLIKFINRQIKLIEQTGFENNEGKLSATNKLIEFSKNLTKEFPNSGFFIQKKDLLDALEKLEN